MFKGDNKKEVRRGAIESRDRFAGAPPGISLTTDNTRWPWGNPPQEVDVDTVIDEATGRVENDDVFRDELFKLLFAGISIEHIVEAWVIDGFESGKFSLDVGLLAKGPLALYIAYSADQADVPYRMFERDNPEADERMDNEDFLRVLKTNNPSMFAKLREGVNETTRIAENILTSNPDRES